MPLPLQPHNVVRDLQAALLPIHDIDHDVDPDSRTGSAARYTEQESVKVRHRDSVLTEEALSERAPSLSVQPAFVARLYDLLTEATHHVLKLAVHPHPSCVERQRTLREAGYANRFVSTSYRSPV